MAALGALREIGVVIVAVVCGGDEFGGRDMRRAMPAGNLAFHGDFGVIFGGTRFRVPWDLVLIFLEVYFFLSNLEII